MWKLFLLLVFPNVAKGYLSFCSTECPILETPLGKIQGHYDISVKGLKFLAFEGVPFAQPPLGKLRFKDPTPVKPWIGTWQAHTNYKCLQISDKDPDSPVIGEEDCLYLNVYTPHANINAQKDVIIYFHGGLFMQGCASNWGPKILMDRNVILVTPNYRLGPLGFISSGDELVGGNAGLKDMVEAIKWVKEHILYFGGNPESVTIAGEEAGAVGVHFMTLARQTAGLFHRAIVQSGNALNAWAVVSKGVKNTQKLAECLGCSSKDSTDMIDCLRRRPAKQIIRCAKTFFKWQTIPYLPFGPIVDKWAMDPILPEHPYILLRKHKVHNVPVLFSNVLNDGLHLAANFVNELKFIDKNWNLVTPLIMDFDNKVAEEDHNITSKNIRDFYFHDLKLSSSTFQNFVKMFNDRLFKFQTTKAIKMHVQASSAPVYYYIYAYSGGKSRVDGRTNLGQRPTQGDDVMQILDPKPAKKSAGDRMVKVMLDLWSSFIQFNQPNILNIAIERLTEATSDPLSVAIVHSPNAADVQLGTMEDYGSTKFWNSLNIRENERLFVKDEL